MEKQLLNGLFMFNGMQEVSKASLHTFIYEWTEGKTLSKNSKRTQGEGESQVQNSTRRWADTDLISSSSSTTVAELRNANGTSWS